MHTFFKVSVCQPDITIPEQPSLAIPETAIFYIHDTSVTIKLINYEYFHSKC